MHRFPMAIDMLGTTIDYLYSRCGNCKNKSQVSRRLLRVPIGDSAFILSRHLLELGNINNHTGNERGNSSPRADQLAILSQSRRLFTIDNNNNNNNISTTIIMVTIISMYLLCTAEPEEQAARVNSFAPSLFPWALKTRGSS